MLGTRSRIPVVIWIALYAVAIIGMASAGYQAGLAGTRRSPASMGLVLAFAGVLYLVADLDRPSEGLLTTSQAAMIDLQKSMKGATP
jgi:predicted transporter